MDELVFVSVFVGTGMLDSTTPTELHVPATDVDFRDHRRPPEIV
jgi:hypothetical protein